MAQDLALQPVLITLTKIILLILVFLIAQPSPICMLIIIHLLAYIIAQLSLIDMQIIAVDRACRPVLMVPLQIKHLDPASQHVLLVISELIRLKDVKLDALLALQTV